MPKASMAKAWAAQRVTNVRGQGDAIAPYGTDLLAVPWGRGAVRGV